MTATGDWMKWALDQPLVAEPGTRFNYSTGNSHLFAGIIYKTAGVHATEFAEERLFGPLGIDNYFWYMGDGYPATGGSFGGLKLRPRDMAKFGAMYLNDGRWKGEQVVPMEWVSDYGSKSYMIRKPEGYLAEEIRRLRIICPAISTQLI